MKILTSRLSSLRSSKFSAWQLAVFVVVFGAIGGVILLLSKAAPIEPKPLPVSNHEASFPSSVVLVRLTPQANRILKQKGPHGLPAFDNLNKTNHAKKVEQVAKPTAASNLDEPLFRWYKITLGNSLKPVITPKKDKTEYLRYKRILNQYKADANTEVAEPDFNASITAVPNDPYYSSSGSWGQPYDDQWDIKKINAAAAWNQTTGSKSVIVADIDTGIDYNHPDLKANLWTAADGSHGWNFVNNTNDPLDDQGHGTHTAGTIGAVGNNGVGISGVNWAVSIMALKFLDANGSGALDAGANALQWAADHGARVSNNSWGCAGCNTSLIDDAVKYEHDKGMTVVMAAGNSSWDALDFSPADSDYALTVSSTDHNDALSNFSNYGERIDVAAPGGDSRDSTYGTTYAYANVLSLRAGTTDLYCAGANVCNTMTVGTNYYRARGTSMAAPHVAGLAALLLAKNPNLSNEEIRQIIRAGADDIAPAGKDASTGYGRINAGSSMNLVNSHPLTPVITSPSSRTTINGQAVTISGSVGGPNFASWKLEAGYGRSPTSWTTMATSTTQPTVNGPLAVIDSTKLNDGWVILRLSATDSAGKVFQYEVFDITVKNFDASIYSPIKQVSLGVNQVYGLANPLNGLTFSGYKLEWGAGTAPTSWSTVGISLANNGKQAVPLVDYNSGGTLATWDTSQLTDGLIYTLRLTITTAQGATKQFSRSVTANKAISPGWPKALCTNYCLTGEPAPVLADLTGSGKKQVIIPSAWNKLYVFNKDGTPFPGFPVTVDNDSAVYDQGVNAADLNGDGKKEIILTASVYVGTSGRSKIYIFNSDGSRYPGWPITVNICHGGLDDGTVSVADLNNDGRKELVFIERAFPECIVTNDTQDQIDAYLPDGSQLTGFPKPFTHPLPPLVDYGESGGWHLYGETPHFGPPTIADVNNDGKPEIFWSYGDRAYLFDAKGNLKPGWPFVAPLSPYSGKIDMFGNLGAVANAYGDKNLELFMYGRDLNSNGYGIMYGLKPDGSVMPGWPIHAGFDMNWGYKIPQTITAADLGISGGRDNILATYGSIYAYNGDGTLATHLYNQSSDMSANIVDANGDNKLEITGQNISTNSWGELVLSDADAGGGTSYFKVKPIPDGTEAMNNPLAIADLGDDGSLQVVTSVDTFLDYDEYEDFTMWSLPNNGGRATYDWPMIGQNPAHTSRLTTASSGSTDTTPPTAPTGLSATAPAYNQVNLAWTASTDNIGVAGYYIVRNGTTIAQTTGTGTTYTDSSVTASTTYSYLVMAFDALGNTSRLSNTASVTTPSAPDTTPPAKPTNLTATAVSPSQINLSWQASTDNVGVTAYIIFRNSTKIASVSGSVTSFGDTGLRASTTYTYYVIARDAAGNRSVQSNNAKTTTLATLPGTGYLTGKVTDSSTGAGIAGALVSLTRSGQTGVMHASTGPQGAYKLINLPPDTYTAQYSAAGYTAQQYSLNIIVDHNINWVSLVKQN